MKIFSPEKANALIPRLESVFEDLWVRRRELAITLLQNDPAVRGIQPAPHPRVVGVRAPFAPGPYSELKAEIVRLINRIEAHGCIVKDIDIGLIDFPSLREGVPVYLCWKVGERRVGYWHGADEGFKQRKPLDG
ncbi:MAG: DUF2203 family protein [Vulcanimicrobiaceae bacterium]|jgi:hypothetical protein